MAKKQKNPTAKYAVIGLIVALLACISTGLAGVVMGSISLGMFTLEKEPVTLWLQISLGLLVVGLASYAIMNPDAVRRFFTGRQARYGSNSLILAVAFLGILGVVNYLVYDNPKSWDLTEDQTHTLAPETLQTLATLPEPVQAVAFYSVNLDSSSAEQLLQDMKANSEGKFDYTFVDPDADPLTARQAGITGDGKILLQMGDRKEIASFATETELTRSMIRLISPEARVVYFLEGHGEPSLEAGGQNQLSFSTASETLGSKNYTVKTLNLLVTNSIPEDAQAIVVAGPQKPLTQAEVNLLKKYVNGGGSLVIMENPVILTEFGEDEDPLAAYLQKDWGITLNNDIIFDLASQQPLNAISASFSSTHPITKNLSINYVVIMPQARSLGAAEAAPENVTLTPLILTSDQSWGETQLSDDPNAQYKYDDGIDNLGPLYMSVAGENSETKGRVVVFGNSIFATDDAFDAYGNGNMFVNSVDWAAEQEDLINITPKEPISRMFIPPSQLQLIIILIGSIFVLPGLVVFAGISTWLSRRKRG